ncbi:MAG: hypothetical protein WBW71_03475, partial [Bacteroidota bacterium]
ARSTLAFLQLGCSGGSMTVYDVDNVAAHCASDLLPINIVKLFLDVPEAQKKDEREYHKQFERQYKEGNAKRYNDQRR